MYKMSVAACAALMLTAATASSQIEREPPSLGKKYVGCVEGNAANGYAFSVAAPAGSTSTRPHRYGLVAGKKLGADLAAMVGKRVEIVATLADDKHSTSASASTGSSSSTRSATSSREVLTANIATVVPGACAP